MNAKEFALKKYEEISQDDRTVSFHHLESVARLIRQKRYSLPFYIGCKQPIEQFHYHQVLKDVSYLQDIIEYTNTTYEEIEVLFGESVAKIVLFLTDINDGTGRAERIVRANERYSQLNFDVFEEWAALAVKPADRYVRWKDAIKRNDREYIDIYFNEYKEFRKAVYRNGTYKPVWDLLDELYLQVRNKYK